jgi:hypothetical protein
MFFKFAQNAVSGSTLVDEGGFELFEEVFGALGGLLGGGGGAVAVRIVSSAARGTLSFHN